MRKRIKVVGIPRPEPDVRLYVLALIELARQLQAEESTFATAPPDDSTAVPAPESGQ
jgi:hypothetical protein